VSASSASPYSIDVVGLHKSFGKKHVVNDVSLRVERGEIFGFLGPNGSGKTTTIRLMCGLLTPDAGSGTCLGYDIRKEQAQIKRHVGYMTQKFSFWEDLTIRENLDFVARLYEMPDRRRVVADAIEGLGLSGRANQLAGALSGGWKQRLALAACMLHKPELLLLDEPTAGVDPKARRDFWDELHQLAAAGVSVLVSTHYMDEAERCHKLAYIAYGQLMTHGTAPEIIAEQGLHTWRVEGGDLAALTRALRGQPGVDQAAVFGSALHVTGKDGEALEASLRAACANSSSVITRTEVGLEDVFIHLMARSQDNFGAAS
jgi:ABC-2 type transport system ATP-binding protein